MIIKYTATLVFDTAVFDAAVFDAAVFDTAIVAATSVTWQFASSDLC